MTLDNESSRSRPARRSSARRQVFVDAAARQRGTSLMVVMVALTGLAALGGLTVLTVRGGGRAADSTRAKTIALYAAESGAAAAIDFLRGLRRASVAWSTIMTRSNEDPASPDLLIGNNVRPGEVGNPFDPESQAWYQVWILNNPSDPSFAAGADSDNRVIIRAIGYGPNDAVASVEWEVRSNTGTAPTAMICQGYGQRGLAEDNAGRNDCLATIDSSATATYTPGGP